MSTSIDNRVVEMKFDNSNFEKNIATTKNTLEKFKNALNITSSAERFNRSLTTAVNGVSFDKMASSLQSLEQRFSSLGIVGVTILQNLTNSAINAAKSIASTLTEGVLQGGKNRAQNIENAKFQLEGLDIAWKDIQADIQYGVDKTAYGLDSAAMAASQLVASGVKFGKTFGETGNSPMAKALRGISGLSAMTNSSYDDMARIFTTVAGNGRLMGEQLLQVSSRGINAAATMVKVFNGVNAGSKEYNNISEETKQKIKELTGGLELTEESLRDLVSKGKIDFAMFSEAMDSAFGAHAKDANKTLNGVLSNIRAALAKIGADFWTPIIRNNGVLVHMLNSFRERINDVRDAIHGMLGWKESKEGIEYLSKWQKLVDGIFKKIKKRIDKINVKSLTKNVTRVIKIVINLAKSVKNIFSAVLNIFNNIRKAFNSVFGITRQNTIIKFVEKLSERFVGFTKKLAKGRDEGSKVFDIFEKIFRVIKDAYETAKMLISSIRDVFSNLYGEFKRVIEPIKEAFKSVFDNASFSDFFKNIQKVITKFRDFFTTFKLNDDTIEGITGVFQGFFSVVDIGYQLLSGVWSVIKKIVKAIVPVTDDVVKLAGGIGKIVYKLDEFLKKNEIIKTIFETIGDIISGVIITVRTFFSSIVEGFLTSAFGVSSASEAFELLGEKIKSFGEKVRGFIEKHSPQLIEFGSNIGSIFGKLAGFIGSIFTKISKIVEKFAPLIKTFISETIKLINALVDAIINLVNNLDTKKTVELAHGGIFAAILVGFKRLIDNGGLVVRQTASIFRSLSEAIQTAVGVKAERAKIIREFAVSIGILAGALFLLSSVDPDKLAMPLVVVSTLLWELKKVAYSFGTIAGIQSNSTGFFGMLKDGILGIMDSFRKAQHLKMQAEALMRFAASVFILAGAVRLLATIEPERMVSGLAGVTAIITELVILSEVLQKNEIKMASGSLGLILFSASIIILSKAVTKMAELSWPQLYKGLLGLTVILIDLAGLSYILGKSKADNAIAKLGLSMIPFSIGVNILSKSVKTFSNLSWDGLARGLVGLAGALAGIVGLSVSLTTTNAEKSIARVGLAMIPFSTGVLILSASIKNMSELSWNGLAVGLSALAGALAGVAALAITIKTTKTTATMLALGLAMIPFSIGISVLFKALKKITELSWENVLKSLTMFAATMGVVSAYAITLSKTKSSMLSAAAGLLIFAAAMRVLTPVLTEFGNMSVKQIIFAFAGLAAALGIITGFAILLKHLKLVPILFKFSGSMVLLGAACVLVGAGLLMVGAGIAAIGVGLAAAGAGVLTFISSIMKAIPTIIRGLGSIIESFADAVISGLPAIIRMVVAIIEAVCKAIVEEVPTIMKTLLSILDNLITYVPKIVDKLITVIVSVLDALSGRMPELVNALAKVVKSFVDAVVGLFKDVSLAELVSAISNMSLVAVALAVVGKMGTAALKGLVIMAAIIAGFGLITIALGGLISAIPELEELLEKGIPVMAKIGLAIGELIGGLLGGIAAGASMGLPIIADNLSLFVTKLQPFIDGIRSIDQSVSKNALYLGDAILALVTAGFVENLVSLFGGTIDYAKLGEQLVPFGHSMKEFASAVEGLDSNAATNAAEAGKAIAEMAKALPNSGGVAGFFAGENDMSIVGPQLKDFGVAIMGFATAVSGMDPEVVTNAAEAGKAIAEMAKALPNSGGVAGFFAGENDMSIVGPQLVIFGGCMKEFAISVSGMDPEVVTNAANAGKALGEMASALPNSGGVAGFFAGENDMNTFAPQLVKFGEAMHDYAEAIKDIDIKVVENSASAGTAIAEMAKALPNSGGVAGFFAGENDMDDFGKKLVAFGVAMKLYSMAIIGIDPKVVEASAVAGTAIAKMAADIPNTGGVAGFFAGNNDIDEFAKKLIPFGQALKDYSDVISGINALAVWGTAIAGAALVELAKKMGGSKAEIMELNGIDFTSFGKQLNSFGKGIIEYSNTISDVNYEAVQSTTAVISELIETLIKAASLDAQAGARFSQALSGLAKAGISGFTNTFDSDGKKEAMEAAKRFLVAFADAKNNAYGAGKAIADQVIKALKEYDNSFARAGSDNVTGYIMGMSERESDVYREGYRVGATALRAAKEAVDSNSPSKKFFKLGGDNMIGLANGMADNVGLVIGTADDVSKQALVRVANVMSNMQDIFDNNDIRPVIRPVLDSSEIQNGLSNINSYISRSSVAVGATSYGLASRINQNPYLANAGYNDSKVVSAIGTLESKLEDMTKRLENMQVVLSTGELVGGLSPGINKNLGKMDMLSQRGVV